MDSSDEDPVESPRSPTDDRAGDAQSYQPITRRYLPSLPFVGAAEPAHRFNSLSIPTREDGEEAQSDDDDYQNSGAGAFDTTYIAKGPTRTVDDALSDSLDDDEDISDSSDDVVDDDQDSDACVADTTYVVKGRTQAGDHDTKWPRRFRGQLLSSDDCDVTVLTSTGSIKAHKVVLEVYSDYFKTVFSTSASEAPDIVVSFMDTPCITTTGLAAILEYMYGRSLRLTQHNVSDILEAARYLSVTKVTELCEHFIDYEFPFNIDNFALLFETAQKFGRTLAMGRIELYFYNMEVIMINLDNHLSILRLAAAITSDELITKVLASIARELPKLASSPGLLEAMTAKMLLDMLNADIHGMFTDMTMIDFIVKWVGTSPKDRLPALPGLIKAINLLCFDKDSLNAIAIMPFIRENQTAKRKIARAKRYLAAVGQDGIDDIYLVTIHDGNMDFYITTNQAIVTRAYNSVIPNNSRKHRNKGVCLSCSSVISVGDILFILGKPDVDGESPCYSYNPSRRFWKELAPLQGSREDYQMVCMEGEVYAIGGRMQNSELTSRVDVYNFDEDKWNEGIPLPRPISSLQAAVFYGRIYVLDPGDYNKRIPAIFAEYDPGRRRWESNKCSVCSKTIMTGRVGHLLSEMESLYHIYQRDGRVVTYDLIIEHYEEFYIGNKYEDFSIEYALSHRGMIYLIASYTQGCTNQCSLFRLNDREVFEVVKIVELKIDVDVDKEKEIPRKCCAMISVPNILMDCTDANFYFNDIDCGDEAGDFKRSSVTGITNTDGRQPVDYELRDNFLKHFREKCLSFGDPDVTLVTRSLTTKTTTKAHKDILAANSEYFKTMFRTPCSEASGVVSFEDNPYVSSTGLDVILEYLYTGCCRLTQDNVCETFEAAHHFLMTEITDACNNFVNELPITTDNCSLLYETVQRLTLDVRRVESFFKVFEANMVTADNYLGIFHIALANNWNEAMTKVITFIARELPTLVSSQELFNIVTETMLFDMLKVDKHGVFTDMTLVEFIVQWVGKSPEDRLPVLPKLIKQINLFCFKVDTLDKIANLPFIEENKMVKKTISKARKYLSAIKKHDFDDYLYLVTMPYNDIKFYCATNTSTMATVTKSDILVIPSRKRAKHEVNLSSSSVLSLGDTLFILGRPDQAGESPCYSYNPDRDVWRELAPLHGTRDDYAMVYLEDHIYVICGSKCSQLTGRVDIYNIGKDEWDIATPQLPLPFWSFQAAVLHGRIYVYGLYGHDGAIKSALLVHNPGSEQWEQRKLVGSLCADRGLIGHFLPGVDVLYHIYKFPHGSLVAERYDPRSEKWTKSVIRHTVKDFSIEYGLSHGGAIYLVVSVTPKKDTDNESKICSLLWFNDATGKVELLIKNVENGSRVGAMVQVPKPGRS